jgi:hypothetical protein
VRALYVVGVNLQLWFRHDTGIVTDQEVLVRLIGIGLLRDLVDVDLAAEDTIRFIGEDALVELVTLTIWCRVLDTRVVVDMLLPS